jgi:hypothetical protein
MATEWRVTRPDGMKGTAVAWTKDGHLVVRFDEAPQRLLWYWPEELATDTGKPLGYGFAAGLPIQEGDDT